MGKCFTLNLMKLIMPKALSSALCVMFASLALCGAITVPEWICPCHHPLFLENNDSDHCGPELVEVDLQFSSYSVPVFKSPQTGFQRQDPRRGATCRFLQL